MKVTTQHRLELRDAVAKAYDDFLGAVKEFDENSLNQIPSAGSWTPAQVVVHILIATDGLPDSNTTPTHRQYDASLPRIRPWWEDLSQKFTAPEQLRPDGQPRSGKNLQEELQRVRTKNLAIIDKEDLSVVCLDFELPGIGYLTRYEWLWFGEMHLKRHQFQLENMLKVVSP